ncbi:hypothetical protein JCM11251_007158 [Rhodosporidiobolus azoricus]
MVAHLSYKFTHLAQSLRSGHLTNTLRNAFPSTATPAPTFDFTSNVFGSVSNAANSVGGSATTIGMAAGAFGAGAGAAAGAGGGAAGGAGGASSKAGSWSSWGFQSGKSMNQGQAAQADSSNQLDNADEDLRAFASPSTRRSLLRRSRSPVGLRSRSSFTPSSPGRPSHPDLLSADEAGLSSVRLSGVEMQRMYHTAFAQGKMTDEVKELEMEADEVDLGVAPTDVLRTGRRASISISGLPSARSAPLVSLTGLGTSARRLSLSGQRPLHTSASSASPAPSPSPVSSSHPPASALTTPTLAPPQASLPFVRRNSTSAVSSTSTPVDSSIPFINRSKTPPPFFSSEKRPPIDGEKKKGARWAEGKSPEEIARVGKRSGTLQSPEAQERNNAILAAEKTGKPNLVARAVQQYLAAPSTWSTYIHNTAMAALYKTRQPNDPLDRIVELYNQLFSDANLHPTTMSYDTIIRSFCTRDDEVRRNIGYIERRLKKKALAAKARGLNWQPDESKEVDDRTSTEFDDDLDSRFAMKHEVDRLQQLRSSEFDYFTPALQIFKALGTLGDRLPSASVQMLMQCAAHRGDVDVALALFERLEKSPFQQPTYRAYQHLITMYGEHEKNAELVKEVFEGYLAARASGALREIESAGNSALRRPRFRYTSVKHAYDTEPDYLVEQDDRQSMIATGESGDERIWATTMAALFAANDAAGAVSLLERMLAAQNAPESLAPGYPKTLMARTIGLIVRGFVSVGDEPSARKWFDKFASPSTGVKEEDIPHAAFFTGVLYPTVDSSLPTCDFLNHVYRTMLAVASKANPIEVSDFVTVIDCNLATTWSTSASPEEKQRALDAIVEFRSTFEQVIKAGFLAPHVGDFRVSSGLLSRIAIAEAKHALFPRATTTFLELANLVRAAMRDTPADADEARSQSFRPRTTWAVRISDVARHVLGIRAGSEKKSELRGVGEALIAVQDAVKVAGWTNKLRRVVDWTPEPFVELAVVQSYLASRRTADATPGSLALSGDEWFTVLEAFAHSASLAKRAPADVPFDIPEFRLVFQDFLASGAEIPVRAGMYDYETLGKKLKEAGYRVDEVRGFIEAMNRNVSFEPAVNADAQASPASFVEDDAVSLASGPFAPATSATAPSVADSAESQRYPTPPSTPPAYFAELAPAQAPAPEAAPAPTPATFDRQLGTQIEQLAFVGRMGDATRLALEGLDLAVSAAREGRYAHPDSYGRLIEQLGRQHLVEEVRQVYLLAYQALNDMASEPEAQSIAWVMLEDKMIVALAQAGELFDVGHHRDRLLQAGCAPSADAYAAMILNMKDTTDDAAVALTLFEESQQLNVRPNVYLFNTLISKLSRARRAKEALEYFELMKHSGITPTSITYGAIINACCKTGDDVSADYLFAEMVSRPDFKPRVPPYNTMIQFYTSTKPDRARALHYYNELVKARVDPTAHTYKLLLDAYGATGDVPDLEAMQQVFAGLVADKKVKVSGAHWAALINAYGVVAKDVDRAIAIFDSIAAHPTTRNNPNGPLPDAVVYEALLNGLIANGKAELCDQYLEEMRTKGVRMTAYVANTLIKGYTAQSLYSSARRIFTAMSEPPSGVASAGNHPIDRHPKHHHLASTSPTSVDAPTYREPSTYEAMILCELKAGEVGKAAEVLRLAEARAFPPAVIGRLQKLLTDEGVESLPLQQ